MGLVFGESWGLGGDAEFGGQAPHVLRGGDVWPVKLVFIAAPLMPTDEEKARWVRRLSSCTMREACAEARRANRARAASWCAWAARQGVAPVATWIVLSGQWDESPENRALGLACGCAAIERCDELWLVGGRVSDGMQLEAGHARQHGVPVVDLTHLGEEPPA